MRSRKSWPPQCVSMIIDEGHNSAAGDPQGGGSSIITSLRVILTCKLRHGSAREKVRERERVAGCIKIFSCRVPAVGGFGEIPTLVHGMMEVRPGLEISQSTPA